VTAVTVNNVDGDQADDAPPPGTAIVRPLRHVQAVRERHLQRFADAAEVAASRSARAWIWALGETVLAPVTDQQTASPPSRADIEGEIAAADERRLRGDRQNRADAAATILRWLIGEDDRIPVRCENPGELVGGFGHIVRSPEQIAHLMATVVNSQCQAVAPSREPATNPDQRQCAAHEANYLSGIVATLAWVLGEASAPITRTESTPTTRYIKTERLHAEDLIDQVASPSMTDSGSRLWYGEGVRSGITWLLGDSTVAPPGLVRPGPASCATRDVRNKGERWTPRNQASAS
jgi:hypothetical protein